MFLLLYKLRTTLSIRHSTYLFITDIDNSNRTVVYKNTETTNKFVLTSPVNVI